MNGRRVGSIALVVGGATAAAALALAATSATAQADTPVEPSPFLGEFPAFTDTPTTIFEIPGILQDVQGDVETPFFGVGPANEFTSVLGIQNAALLEYGGLIFVDELQLTLPGTMGSASDALFENDFQFESTFFGIADRIGFPAAGYALEAAFSEIGGGFVFYTPFGDFPINLYFNV
ncbi:hypothetical protein [Mycobacterium shimoidei]|uniref:hypothetical protein n=1 Tax=Mycobacterium shimoidei TaxID=29313 RepID=UPI00111BFDF6|nr:hypothetical protein [Mycobacterium shimoidei]MCV7260938.1 hypothetical protein [Mycobacterium shimoidei]